MRVHCEECGRWYDDARRWTICPHPSLNDPPPRKDRLVEAVNQCSRHPAIQGILQFFEYAHLPEHLQAASKPFCELAERIADGPQNAEATVALRKLLEAKDAAVRAVLFK